jgi:hypothetical protein
MMDLSSELGARSSSESSMVSSFSIFVVWFKQEVLGRTVMCIFLQMLKSVCWSIKNHEWIIMQFSIPFLCTSIHPISDTFNLPNIVSKSPP